MKKNNYHTIIDFGKEKIRLAVFNKDSKNIFSISKEIQKKENYDEHSKSLNYLIRSTEKKISSHLNNVTVLFDHSQFYSIDISIKKEFDQPTNLKETYASLLQEANLLIFNNYLKDKIVHIIKINSIYDGIDFYEDTLIDKKAKSIIIELKFLCLNWKIYENISNIFKKNNLEIIDFYCSSYIKSYSYINFFSKKDNVTFLDIGSERSTIIFYNKNRPVFFNSIPIGGNHITKDISKILKLTFEESEKIKKTFNKSEIEFSFDQNMNNEKKKLIQQIIGKNISIDLLKKVVLARVEEIIFLSLKEIDHLKYFNNSLNYSLILTGNGSNLFDKNSFHLDDKYNFEEISFYEENDSEICNAGYNFDNNGNNLMKIISKNDKKTGFFENFFNFFSR